jgi:hypothetical protein
VRFEIYVKVDDMHQGASLATRATAVAMTCLLFASGVALGEDRLSAAPPPSQSKPKLPATAPTAKKAALAPAAVDAHSAPGSLREAAAELLERNIAYRTILDSGAPKLLEAKFVGPIQRKTWIFGPVETIYCVSAKLDIWPVPYERVALLRINSTESGQVRMAATIGLNQTPSGCALIKNYGPFPELEAARQRRRHAMGKD